jgi:hypothetical protein
MILNKKRNVNYQNKKINTIYNTDKQYSTEDIYNKIIPKQSDNKYTEKQFKDLYKQKTELLKQNQFEAEKKRKNNPYKCIISEFDYSKQINNNKDLVVFRPEDENKEDFDKDVKKYTKTIKEQDSENKNIYSEDNKINYIKNFEYVQKYKYKSNIDDNIEESGDNLRNDRIEHYNKKKIEDDKNATVINDIFSDLISNNIMTEDMENIDLDKLDADDLEQKLIQQFGKEEYEKMINDINL